MNLILNTPSAVPFFTDVRMTLSALGVTATEYDWFISDVDANSGAELLATRSCWLSGEELQHLLTTQDIQFNWGVLSAVAKGTRFDVESEPHADGNVAYWRTHDLLPQLPGALFEIACWDSSATILVGLSEAQAAAFQSAFPQAKPLASEQSYETTPNPSIEGTPTSGLRPLAAAPHVKR